MNFVCVALPTNFCYIYRNIFPALLQGINCKQVIIIIAHLLDCPASHIFRCLRDADSAYITVSYPKLCSIECNENCNFMTAKRLKIKILFFGYLAAKFAEL